MPSDVLDYVRSKEPAFEKIDDDTLTQYVADRHPEFLSKSESFAKSYQDIVSTKPGGSLAPSLPDSPEPAEPSLSERLARIKSSSPVEKLTPLTNAVSAKPKAPQMPQFESPIELPPVQPGEKSLYEEETFLDKPTIRLGDSLFPEGKALNPRLGRVAPHGPVSGTVDSEQGPVQAGVSEAMREAVNSLTTPRNLLYMGATIGVGASGAAGKALASAFWTAFMGKSAIEEAPVIATELGQEMAKPEADRDKKKIAKLLTQAGLTTAMTVAPAVHFGGEMGLGDKPTAIPELRKELGVTPPVAPVSPDLTKLAPATAQVTQEVLNAPPKEQTPVMEPAKAVETAPKEVPPVAEPTPVEKGPTDAGKISAPVEVAVSEPPGSAPQMAEGESGEVQSPARTPAEAPAPETPTEQSALTASPSTVRIVEHPSVPVDFIESSQKFRDPAIVEKYRQQIRNNEPMEPIDVIVDQETGKFSITNGHHKLEAAKLEGLEYVPVKESVHPYERQYENKEGLRHVDRPGHAAGLERREGAKLGHTPGTSAAEKIGDRPYSMAARPVRGDQPKAGQPYTIDQFTSAEDYGRWVQRGRPVSPSGEPILDEPKPDNLRPGGPGNAAETEAKAKEGNPEAKAVEPPLISEAERASLVQNDTTPSEIVARMESEEAAYKAKVPKQTGAELQKEYESQQAEKSKAVAKIEEAPKSQTPSIETLADQKKGFDAKEAKAQKKFLLDEISKAIDEAPEVSPGYHTEELKNDKAVVSESFSHSSGGDYAQWKAEHQARVEPLFDKYNIPKSYPGYEGYKSIDGSMQMGYPAGTYDFTHRENLLEQAIEKENSNLGEKVVIDIPGDGTFTIHNNKSALKDFQERAKKFPTAAPRGQKITTPRSGPSNPSAVGSLEPEQIKKAAALSTSDDPTRQILGNIYSDGKQTVATNGRMLTRINKGIGGTEKKPLVQTPEGAKDESGIDFPNFKQVIPDKNSLDVVTKEIDTARLFSIAKQAQQATSETYNAISLIKNKDGSIGVISKSPNIGEYGHNVQPGNKQLISLDPEYLINALNSARMVGDEKVSIEMTDSMSPIVIRGKNSESVIMPVRLGDEVVAPSSTTKPEPAKSKPIVGMGGAVESEFGSDPNTFVSNMFAVIDKAREAMGKPPMEKVKGRTWDQDNATAFARMNRDPNWIPDLIRDVLDKPRPLLSWENAGLVWYRQKWTAELDNALSRISRSFDDGDQAALSEAKAQAASFEDRIEELDRAVGRGGTGSEAGRTLQAQKMGAGDDFTLVEMRLRKRAAVGGRPLTDAESEQITQLHQQLEAAQKAHEAYQAQADQKRAELETQLAIEKLAREQRQQPVVPPHVRLIADKVKDYFDKRGDAALKRLQGKLFTLSPQVLADLTDLGASRIISGAIEFGEWSVKMTEALGDKVKPHLQTIWEAAQAALDDHIKKVAGIKSDAVKRAVKGADLNQQKENVTQAIKGKVDSGKRNEVTSMVQRLARLFVEQGIKQRDPLIDAVHGVLKEIDPTFTRRETMDAISGYGDFKQLSKDQISKELRDLKGQMQQVSKLEDMEAGRPPLKTGVERREVSKEESRLIKLVNEAKQKFQVPITDPNTQLKSSLDTLKTRMANRIDELNEKMKSGDFTKKPRREIILDKAGTDLKVAYEKTKQKFERMLAIDRLSKRSMAEKVMDTFVKWRRGLVLSSPVTLGKLTTAAIARAAITPIEEVIGGAISKVIPEVAKRAPREGGFNSRAIGKYYAQGFTQGMRDAWSTLKSGQSSLDVLHGGKFDPAVGEGLVLDKSVVDYIGYSHGALKAPIKRAEFELSLEKRIENAIRNGVDPSDPLVMTRLAAEAYKDGNRTIFLQDNVVMNAYKRAMSGFEKRDPVTGRAVSLSHKAVASTARILLPVVRVPTNIVAEALQYATGSVTGLGRLANALRKGVETLEPDQADLIMRELKKGSLGAALLLTGYLLPEFIGGYYQRGQKRASDDVKPGGARISGVEIPKFFGGPDISNKALHNPALEVLQMGSTIRRVEESKLHKKDLETRGITVGMRAALLGLTEETPFIHEMIELAKMWSPHEQEAFFGELAKSLIVPQGMQWAAQQMDTDSEGDPIKRKPKTLGEHIATGVPGLRENVPTK